MTDKELLELAAKAAKYHWVDGGGKLMIDVGRRFAFWNPLTDDGDALRLAMKLGLCVDIDAHSCCTRALTDTQTIEGASEDHNNDPYAATRRAIVRAAAEIGKGME